jgi:hypothetical protein
MPEHAVLLACSRLGGLDSLRVAGGAINSARHSFLRGLRTVRESSQWALEGLPPLDTHL